jgi:hypothetical protein
MASHIVLIWPVQMGVVVEHQSPTGSKVAGGTSRSQGTLRVPGKPKRTDRADPPSRAQRVEDEGPQRLAQFVVDRVVHLPCHPDDHGVHGPRGIGPLLPCEPGGGLHGAHVAAPARVRPVVEPRQAVRRLVELVEVWVKIHADVPFARSSSSATKSSSHLQVPEDRFISALPD